MLLPQGVWRAAAANEDPIAAAESLQHSIHTSACTHRLDYPGPKINFVVWPFESSLDFCLRYIPPSLPPLIRLQPPLYQWQDQQTTSPQRGKKRTKQDNELEDRRRKSQIPSLSSPPYHRDIPASHSSSGMIGQNFPD